MVDPPWSLKGPWRIQLTAGTVKPLGVPRLSRGFIYLIRHRFAAHLLTNNRTKIISQKDYHHYYMPDRNSVAIGCFPVLTESVVPIFSRPGRDIAMFEVATGGGNLIKKLMNGMI